MKQFNVNFYNSSLFVLWFEAYTVVVVVWLFSPNHGHHATEIILYLPAFCSIQYLQLKCLLTNICFSAPTANSIIQRRFLIHLDASSSKMDSYVKSSTGAFCIGIGHIFSSSSQPFKFSFWSQFLFCSFGCWLFISIK